MACKCSRIVVSFLSWYVGLILLHCRLYLNGDIKPLQQACYQPTPQPRTPLVTNIHPPTPPTPTPGAGVWPKPPVPPCNRAPVTRAPTSNSERIPASAPPTVQVVAPPPSAQAAPPAKPIQPPTVPNAATVTPTTQSAQPQTPGIRPASAPTEMPVPPPIPAIQTSPNSSSSPPPNNQPTSPGVVVSPPNNTSGNTALLNDQPTTSPVATPSTHVVSAPSLPTRTTSPRIDKSKDVNFPIRVHVWHTPLERRETLRMHPYSRPLPPDRYRSRSGSAGKRVDSGSPAVAERSEGEISCSEGTVSLGLIFPACGNYAVLWIWCDLGRAAA